MQRHKLGRLLEPAVCAYTSHHTTLCVGGEVYRFK